MDLPDDINMASIYPSADSNPRSMLLTKPNIEQYARNFAVSPRLEFIDRCKVFSMLHHEALLLLNFFARWHVAQFSK